MPERKRYIPERVARNLKNDYDHELPEGSILVDDFRSSLISYYLETMPEKGARSITGKIIRNLTAHSFTSYRIKNPDSIRNQTIERYFNPTNIDELLSIDDKDVDKLKNAVYKRVFKNKNHLRTIQMILRKLVEEKNNSSLI